MASDIPPTFYFNGIIYNPLYYASKNTTASNLTQGEADSRYLIKTISDSTSSTAIETFKGGIITPSISATSSNNIGINCSGTLSLSGGITNISTGNINIGSDGASSIVIGSSSGAVSINDPLGVEFLNGLKTNTINPYSGSSLTIGAPLTISYSGVPTLSTQIGYYNQLVSSGSATITGTQQIASLGSIAAGVWLLEASLLSTNMQTSVCSLSFTNVSATNFSVLRSVSYTPSPNNLYMRLTAVIQNASATAWWLTGASSASQTLTNVNVYITRIA